MSSKLASIFDIYILLNPFYLMESHERFIRKIQDIAYRFRIILYFLRLRSKQWKVINHSSSQSDLHLIDFFNYVDSVEERRDYHQNVTFEKDGGHHDFIFLKNVFLRLFKRMKKRFMKVKETSESGQLHVMRRKRHDG